MDCPPKKMAIVERWLLWRGGCCGEVAVVAVQLYLTPIYMYMWVSVGHKAITFSQPIHNIS